MIVRSMNVEHFEPVSGGMNEATAAAMKPAAEHDYSGKSLRMNGEDVAETILREFKVDPEDPKAVQTVMRSEKNTLQKARLSNLYRKWQEEKSKDATESE